MATWNLSILPALSADDPLTSDRAKTLADASLIPYTRSISLEPILTMENIWKSPPPTTEFNCMFDIEPPSIWVLIAYDDSCSFF